MAVSYNTVMVTDSNENIYKIEQFTPMTINYTWYQVRKPEQRWHNIAAEKIGDVNLNIKEQNKVTIMKYNTMAMYKYCNYYTQIQWDKKLKISYLCLLNWNERKRNMYRQKGEIITHTAEITMYQAQRKVYKSEKYKIQSEMKAYCTTIDL